MTANKIMITCREATYYVSKKEEGKLSFKVQFQLFIHLLICKFCRLFAKQNEQIIREVKHLHTSDSLTELEKEQIHARIHENNSLE
jgi:hypothetical protein